MTVEPGSNNELRMEITTINIKREVKEQGKNIESFNDILI